MDKLASSSIPPGKPTNGATATNTTSSDFSFAAAAKTTATTTTAAAAAAPSSALVAKHKIVLLGDQSVGKTSLVTRFMYDTFDQQYQATIGIDFFSKTMHVDNRTVRLHMWDTAGQERFHSLIPSYIRNSSGTLVVYDISSRSSFLNTFKWVDEVRAERGDDVVIFLIGNKSDMQEQREVSMEEAQKKAEEYNLVFMEVSARQGTNVKALFRNVAQALPALDDNSDGGASASPSGHLGGNHASGGATVTLVGGKRDPFLVAPSRMRENGARAAQSNGPGGYCC